jgi:hypothetical protein
MLWFGLIGAPGCQKPQQQNDLRGAAKSKSHSRQERV